MTGSARQTLVFVAMAVAALAALWLATSGAGAQDGEPPRGGPSPAEELCTPESDRDPMPEVVVRKLGLYYGSVTVAGKVAANGVDTTSLIPPELEAAIVKALPDDVIVSELPRRVSPTLTAVTWLETDVPDEDAAGNLVRYWGSLLVKDAAITPGAPVERGTLYFKIADWEKGSGGFIPTFTPACGVAAVTFFMLDAVATLPGDDDVEPDIFPPTPTPTPTPTPGPPIVVYDPPTNNPVSRPPATPTRSPAVVATPTPLRTVLAAPGLTPTPRVNDDDVAGVIGGGSPPTPSPIPTPRPPATGAGAETGGASPLFLAAVALISGSAGLFALTRNRKRQR